MPEQCILITGGTGLIGSHIRELFQEKKIGVAVLSRNPTGEKGNFQWNIENSFIDPKAFRETNTIIHLAGTSIADGRWTEKRKKEIIESRVKSAELILETL